MLKAVTAEQGIDATKWDPNEVTGLAPGKDPKMPCESAHIDEVFYQFETLAIHCKEAALMCAAALLAFYEETSLDVHEVMAYIIQLRHS